MFFNKLDGLLVNDISSIFEDKLGNIGFAGRAFTIFEGAKFMQYSDNKSNDQYNLSYGRSFIKDRNRKSGRQDKDQTYCDQVVPEQQVVVFQSRQY